MYVVAIVDDWNDFEMKNNGWEDKTLLFHSPLSENRGAVYAVKVNSSEVSTPAGTEMLSDIIDGRMDVATYYKAKDKEYVVYCHDEGLYLYPKPNPFQSTTVMENEAFIHGNMVIVRNGEQGRSLALESLDECREAFLYEFKLLANQR